MIILEMLLGKISLLFCASVAASEFCEWVQVGIDVYISNCKYQFKPRSFPWFSASWCCCHSLFHMKITASVTKSSYQDGGPYYLHLPIFFLHIHTPVLLQNENFLCRSSQIVCMVTTMNVTCTQATLRVHENPCTVFIPLC